MWREGTAYEVSERDWNSVVCCSDLSILEEDEAVKCGYWPLYRYNSDLIKEGKEPLILDYKKPDGTMPEFLDGEDRYATLKEQHPQEAEILRKGLEDNCDRQYEILSDSETFTQTP